MSEFSLTNKEARYLADTDFLRTKADIYRKTDQLLAVTQTCLREYITEQSPAFGPQILTRGGKISRGENYRQLPYHVLDYPRRFSTDDVFALRTMVWWGNHLSFTLHLSGHSFSVYRPKLQSGLSKLQQWNWQVCVGTDPWQYIRDDTYYHSAYQWNENEWLEWVENRKFCKFSKFLSLTQWEQLPDEAVIFLDRVVTLLEL
jgi:hypothetical protein